MSAKSSIEWTGSTWNPIRARLRNHERLVRLGGTQIVQQGTWGYHCEHISPGCVNCYACTMNGRTLPAWGTGLDYTIPNREKVEIFLDEDELIKPRSWRKPRKVFVCSMTDLFAEFVPDEMIDRVFAVMALCPQHTFQVLTKRADRMREYFTGEESPYFYACTRIEKIARETDPHFILDWPPPNVHLGVSVEDQQRAEERILHLLATPAAVRWVSYEPALGPVDFRKWLVRDGWVGDRPFLGSCICHGDGLMGMRCSQHSPRIDWIVIGGESGPGARPFEIDWARSAIAQCKAAGVACFVKQVGRFPNGNRFPEGFDYRKRNKKGGDMAEWPEDIRVREYPAVRS